MRTFAGKPEDMGTRFSAVAEASKMHSLPDGDKLKYFYGMVTEEEKLDIGEAYYEDGYKNAKLEMAKAMLADKVSPEKVQKYTGLTIEEISQQREG